MHWLLLVPFIIISFFLSIVRHELSHAIVGWLHGDGLTLYLYPHRYVQVRDRSTGIATFAPRFSLRFWEDSFFWGAVSVMRPGREKSMFMHGLMDILPCFTGLFFFSLGVVLLQTLLVSASFSVCLLVAVLAVSQGVDSVKMLLQSFQPQRVWLDVNKAIRRWDVPRWVFQVTGMLLMLGFLATIWFWVLPALGVVLY